MTLTSEQQDELSTASRPLMAFLAKHCHPHCSVVVDSERAELLEGVATVAASPYPALKVGQKVFMPGKALEGHIPDPPEVMRGTVIFVGQRAGKFTIEVQLSENITVEVWETALMEEIGIIVGEATIGVPQEFGHAKRVPEPVVTS